MPAFDCFVLNGFGAKWALFHVSFTRRECLRRNSSISPSHLLPAAANRAAHAARGSTRISIHPSSTNSATHYRCGIFFDATVKHPPLVPGVNVHVTVAGVAYGVHNCYDGGEVEVETRPDEEEE